MKTFTLAHDIARANALAAVKAAPDGYRVIVKEAKRTGAAAEQGSAMAMPASSVFEQRNSW